jgi:pimeloyl-ACP methyl ester carboxylesterase
LRGRHGAWQDGFELVKRPFPDLATRVDDLVAADDKVAVRLVLGGTHQGEFQGIPATGRTISYVSHEFYRVANGLFAEEWICSDMACLRQRQASVSYDARNRLGDIRVPALILHGRRNRSMPVALAERMHAGIRGSRIELFCGGHIFFLFAERQQFVDQAGRFLAG